MMSRIPAAVLAGLATFALGDAALAAAPINDAPGSAAEVVPITAENGAPAELQGVAELAEATADAGVPRCLGARSFARTVWFRVSAGDRATRVRVDALTASGQPDERADLAVFVQPATGTQTAEPQACDGGTDGSGVELRVPAGRSLLVQIGARGGAALTRAIAAVRVDGIDAGVAPAGDLGTLAAPRLRAGRATAVPLTGALLTEEDPAQPACPAAASVWRRFAVTRTGTHVAAVRGEHAGALTVFRGTRPTGGGAIACANRGTSATTSVRFTAERGARVWVRIGSDVPSGSAPLAVSGPCDVQPLTRPRAATVRVISVRGRRVRVRVGGGCVRSLRVVVRRGSRVLSRGALAVAPAGTRTVRLGRTVAGRVTVRLQGADAARKSRMVRSSRTVSVGR